MLPNVFHLSSCNDTLPIQNKFKTVVLFHHFRQQTVMYVGCLCRTLSHTDNHIKEIACVDRISKMTESLYHSTIRLRAFKKLDYWWIDCGCVHTCQMDIACQQYFCILFVFLCKIMLLFVFSVDDELQHLSVEILAAVHSRVDRHIIPVSWFYG